MAINKKTKIILSILFLLSFMTFFQSVHSDFCCQTTPESGETSCYVSGVCCKIGTTEEYWHPTGCFAIKVWAEPQTMKFTIAKRTSVKLYIKNEGTYVDSYNIEGNVTQGNPSVIDVDMTLASSATNVKPGEVRTLYPMITVLSSLESNGKVLFNVTSVSDQELYENAVLTVSEGLPTSLPEFELSGLLTLIILVGIVYYFYKRGDE